MTITDISSSSEAAAPCANARAPTLPLFSFGDSGWTNLHRLPCFAPSGRDRKKPEPGEFEAEVAGSEGSTSLKALIVDDQPDVLATTVDLFTMMGYEVLAAGSGDEALEIVKRHGDIDVLFTDVVMPGMDGVTLGRETRKLRPRLKVILVSGFPATALQAQGSDFEEFHFIMKPFSMSQVAMLLRK
jgi:CheY-like chemotaxis protein